MITYSEHARYIPERGMSFDLGDSQIENGKVTIFFIRESATVAEKLKNGVFIETRQAVLPIDYFSLTVVLANLNGFLYETWFYPPVSESNRQCLLSLSNQQYLYFNILETGKYKEPVKSTAIPNPDGAKKIFAKALEVSEKLARLDVDWEREKDDIFSRLPEMDDLWRFLGLSIYR